MSTDGFDRALELLGHHNKSGDDAIDTANRLVHERYPQWPDVTRHSVEATRENWDIERLQKTSLKHKRACPRRVEDPIVVVHHEGIACVIDGNNRVNLAIQRESPALLAVIVLRYLEKA